MAYRSRSRGRSSGRNRSTGRGMRRSGGSRRSGRVSRSRSGSSRGGQTVRIVLQTAPNGITEVPTPIGMKVNDRVPRRARM